MVISALTSQPRIKGTETCPLSGGYTDFEGEVGDLEESGIAARLHLCSQLGQMSLSRISVLDLKAGYCQTRAGRAQKN